MYNTGNGKALYLTGEDQATGKWDTAFKMNVVNAGVWQFKSTEFKEGMKFKVIIYNWIDGTSFQIKTIPEQNLKWENTPGKEGNKSMKFVDNVMEHKPAFNRRKIKKLF